MKTNLIAEIGINHNGDVDLAHRMVDAARGIPGEVAHQATDTLWVAIL